MSRARTTHTVRSTDGTRIAFERSGEGPPVVLVEAAGHYRDFSSFDGIVPLLSREMSVYTYDRRGRGESSDTPPYSPDREIDDLAALIAEAGGLACVYGYSSGALLGLRAAAGGLPIMRLALLEPPLQDDNPDGTASDPLTLELGELVAAGRDVEAVEHFHRSIGVPDEIIEHSRTSPAWTKMASIAHTLVYDCILSDATSTSMLDAVQVPTLVLDSEGSTDDLTGWAAGVAARLPRGTHRSLAGEWHGVADDVLAPVLLDFFNRERPDTAPGGRSSLEALDDGSGGHS